MKHDHHTKEHQQACVIAARTLIQAAQKMLEASQYEWTAVARPTVLEAETEISRAQAQIAQAKRKVEKQEAAEVAAPTGAEPEGVLVWPIPRG